MFHIFIHHSPLHHNHRYCVEHGKQAQLSSPAAAAADRPWAENPSVGSITAMACFVNNGEGCGGGVIAAFAASAAAAAAFAAAVIITVIIITGVSYVMTGDEQGTVAMWRVL